MKNYEKKLLSLAAEMLKEASNEFSNHGCNDLPNGFFKKHGFTSKELNSSLFY